ncbi:MAG TPA: tRNA epoxyqueuosine(34) reductase QueG [Puia sp.]|nr:tRNA epoxyqueuosine(34) reductase QueG [Puia sp.]
MAKNNHTFLIKQWARDLGFDHCGIARAVVLDEDARRLETWLNKGMNGSMAYMENYFDIRIDPTRLVPGARSVITLLLNYFPGREALEKDAAAHGAADRPKVTDRSRVPDQSQVTDRPRVAKYAYGKDYHEVIRDKLKNLLGLIRGQIGEVNGRGFVDSAPVLERSWAVRSGLGWVGKNGNLLNKQTGSFFFIATLIVDLELEADTPFAGDYCGTCRKCIDACPTEAILDNKVVDGSKCISYFTIELKEQLIPEEMKGKFQDWLFGCDTCQDVCPWNRFSSPTREQAFAPIPAILNFRTADWEELTEEGFKEIFRHSALKRTKYAGIQRNLRFIAPGA